MPQYELTTYMRRPEPGMMGTPERYFYLPVEIMITTGFLGKIPCETKVIGVNPAGKDVIMQLCASYDDPPHEQHNAVVDKYRSMGYETAEQPSNRWDDELRRVMQGNGLVKLLQGTGLEGLL